LDPLRLGKRREASGPSRLGLGAPAENRQRRSVILPGTTAPAWPGRFAVLFAHHPSLDAGLWSPGIGSLLWWLPVIPQPPDRARRGGRGGWGPVRSPSVAGLWTLVSGLLGLCRGGFLSSPSLRTVLAVEAEVTGVLFAHHSSLDSGRWSLVSWDRVFRSAGRGGWWSCLLITRRWTLDAGLWSPGIRSLLGWLPVIPQPPDHARRGGRGGWGPVRSPSVAGRWTLVSWDRGFRSAGRGGWWSCLLITRRWTLDAGLWSPGIRSLLGWLPVIPQPPDRARRQG
jgi:hypothetical protein